MLALGAGGTAIANVLTATAAGRMGATRRRRRAFLIPVVALVAGRGVRDEHVAPLSIAGAAVCLAGAWLIRPRPAARRSPRRARLSRRLPGEPEPRLEPAGRSTRARSDGAARPAA